MLARRSALRAALLSALLCLLPVAASAQVLQVQYNSGTKKVVLTLNVLPPLQGSCDSNLVCTFGVDSTVSQLGGTIGGDELTCPFQPAASCTIDFGSGAAMAPVILPRKTDCDSPAVVTSGQACWDTTDKELGVGDGSVRRKVAMLDGTQTIAGNKTLSGTTTISGTLTAAGGTVRLPQNTSLPGSCTEGDVYQDTDSGFGETYVCTGSNTWTKLMACQTLGVRLTGSVSLTNWQCNPFHNYCVWPFSSLTIDNLMTNITFLTRNVTVRNLKCQLSKDLRTGTDFSAYLRKFTACSLGTTKRCLGGSNGNSSCTVASECPSGTCTADGAWLAWNDCTSTDLESGQCVVTGSSSSGAAQNSCAWSGSVAQNLNAGDVLFVMLIDNTRGKVCNGGTNANATCTVDSQCPSSTCVAETYDMNCTIDVCDR